MIYLRARISPRLVLSVPIEGEPSASIVASSFEDQQRLALWLAHSDVLDRLQQAAVSVVKEALDDHHEDAA